MMTRMSKWALLFAGVVACGATAGAQESEYVGYNSSYFSNWTEANDRFTEMEAEIASLRSQLNAARHGDGCTADCGGCGSSCCDPCYRGSCGLYGEVEWMFLRYHRSDGVRIGDNTSSGSFDGMEFDYESTARITVGWIGCSGLGFRARWFEYDHTGNPIDTPDPNVLGVDTYNLDFEMFQQFQVCSHTTVEVSGGVRYNEFDEVMFEVDEVRTNSFDGWGPIVGLEVRRDLGCCGGLYARARAAIVMGDKDRFNAEFVAPGVPIIDEGSGAETLLDSTQGMLELGIGYEWSCCLASGARAFGRAGLEWQNWYNFSSSFAPNDPTGNLGFDGEEYWTGDSDVGFGGFVVSAGVEY